MKRSMLAAVLLLAGCFAPAAFAVDMTIRFTGSFERGTCQFSVNSADLGTYYATSFDASPQTPWTSVVVTRSGCTSDISMIHMATSGTAHPLNGNFWQVPGIAGLGVEIQNAAGVAASPNGMRFDWLPANSTYGLRARFNKVAPITKYGRVTTPVTLLFTYN